MRVIDIEAPSDENTAAPRYTFCVYGPTGSGKTTFAGTFPRVVFLSDTSESGYESLRGISDEVLFEPDVKPIVIGIENMNDMAVARGVLLPFIQSGMVKTIVKDSLTFYSDLYLNYLFQIHTGSGDNLKVYGALGRHLRDLRVKMHSLGCNVVSLCLQSDPNEDQPHGQPLIPGKEGSKYGAGCDYLLYTRYERFKQGQQFVDHFELHSKPWGKFVARARRAIGMPELPSPLMNQTYSSFIEHLGYNVEATRSALPPYDPETPAKIAKAIAASAAVQATPPPAAASAPVNSKPIARHAPTAAKPHTPTAARPAAVRK
jgi:hypothetical protein